MGLLRIEKNIDTGGASPRLKGIKKMYYNASFTLEQAQNIKVNIKLFLDDSFKNLDNVYFDDVPEVYEQKKKLDEAYKNFKNELEKFMKLNERRV